MAPAETVQLYGHTFYKTKQNLLDAVTKQRPEDWQSAFYYVSIDAGQVGPGGEYKLFTGSKEAGPKHWTCFRSLAQLAKYVNALPASARCLYEFYPGNRPARIGFDLETYDMSLTAADFLESTLPTSLAFIERHSGRKYGFGDCAVLSACAETKHSFHVVLPLVLPDDASRAAFSDLVKNELKGVVDTVVYDKGRCMRLPGCHKLGSSRVLKPIDSLGGLTFRPTTQYFQDETVTPELLRQHMWYYVDEPASRDTWEPSSPVPAPVTDDPVQQSGAKRPRTEGANTTGRFAQPPGFAEQFHAVTGVPSPTGSWTSTADGAFFWNPRRGKDTYARRCFARPSTPPHKQNGLYVRADDDGVVWARCMAERCKNTPLRIGFVEPSAAFSVETQAGCTWRAWERAPGVPESAWRCEWSLPNPDTFNLRPTPWSDADVLPVHVSRFDGEFSIRTNPPQHGRSQRPGQTGDAGVKWCFTSTDPCPACRVMHHGNEFSYAVTLYRNSVTKHLCTPCRAKLRLFRDADDMVEFARLLQLVVDAPTSAACVDSALQLLSRFDTSGKFFKARVHQKTGRTYTYGAIARTVVYDHEGLRLVCVLESEFAVHAAGPFQGVFLPTDKFAFFRRELSL